MNNVCCYISLDDSYFLLDELTNNSWLLILKHFCDLTSINAKLKMSKLRTDLSTQADDVSVKGLSLLLDFWPTAIRSDVI